MFGLPGVLLPPICLVTRTPTKFENLAIISDKCHSVARIAVCAAKVAFVHAHFLSEKFGDQSRIINNNNNKC